MNEIIKITKLPKRSILYFDGIPMLLNDEVKVAQQDLITLDNPTGYKGLPYDFFKYKIVHNEVENKEVEVTINFETGPNILSITEIGKLIKEPQQTLWFDNYVAYDNSWDRISIEDVVGKGQWILGKRSDNVQIFPDEILQIGKTYMCYDIHNLLRFEATDEGGIDHYNILTFKKNTATETGDLSTMDIESLFLGIQRQITDSYSFIDKNGDYNLFFETEVHKSFESALANMIVNTNFLNQLTADPLNFLKITSIEGCNETITTLTFTAFDVPLSFLGKTTLSFHLFLKGNTAIAETIDVTLDKINSNPAFVDKANVTLTINTIAT